MRIESLKNQYEDILTLWNNEINTTFRIPKEVFQTQIIKSDYLNKDLSKVVFDEESLIGFMLVKSAKTCPFKECEQTVWISMMFIQDKHRLQGIGKKLISMLLFDVKKEGYKHIHIGKELDNIFCGVPKEFKSLDFFKKQGFMLSDVSSDMHKKIAHDDQITLHQTVPYEIYVSTMDDREDMMRFFQKAFQGRWLYEYQEYMNQGGTGREFVVIKKENKIIGFCRINDEVSPQNMYNRNWRTNFEKLIGIGPLGIDSDYRGLHLGYDITAYTINVANTRGATDIIIDWTSKTAFYEKFGCSIWKQYWSLSIELRG